MVGRLGEGWHELPAPSVSGPTNLPLGIMASARYVQEKVSIAPGDRLFVYTDGVSECPAPGSHINTEMFGDTKMIEVLNASRTDPLTQAGQAVHEALATHAGGHLAHDDCTFMFVEVLKLPPFWKRRILPGKGRVARLRAVIPRING